MNTVEQQRVKTPAFWKLLLICSIASFCALLPADAVPAMASFFHVSAVKAEGIISWFLLGYGIGPLSYAPLANRYGRKVALLIGFLLALASLIVALLAMQFHLLSLLLVMRFFEGVGTSAGLVVGMMLIIDTSSQQQARKTFSLVVLCFAFAPSVAMACGGTLSEYVGFQSLFVLMFLLLLGLLLVVKSIEETYLGPAVPIKVKALACQYAKALVERPFIFLVLVYAVGGAVMYLYNGLTPLIAIGQLHVSSSLFGDLAIIPSLGLFLGALLSTRWSQYYSANRVILIGMLFILLSAVIMLICFYFQWLSLVTILAPSFLLFFGTAIVTPNASMVAVSLSKDAAIASSVMNAMGMLFSSVVVSVASSLMPLGAIVLPLSIFFVTLLAYVCVWLSQKR